MWAWWTSRSTAAIVLGLVGEDALPGTERRRRCRRGRRGGTCEAAGSPLRGPGRGAPPGASAPSSRCARSANGRHMSFIVGMRSSLSIRSTSASSRTKGCLGFIERLLPYGGRGRRGPVCRRGRHRHPRRQRVEHLAQREGARPRDPHPRLAALLHPLAGQRPQRLAFLPDPLRAPPSVHSASCSPRPAPSSSRRPSRRERARSRSTAAGSGRASHLGGRSKKVVAGHRGIGYHQA